MVVGAALLRSAAGGSPDESNMRSVLTGLERFGEAAGLERPHRFTHYVAQLAHESGRFRYDEEIWGPTPAQRRYEDRADLGHGPGLPGEAFLPRPRRPPADRPGKLPGVPRLVPPADRTGTRRTSRRNQTRSTPTHGRGWRRSGIGTPGTRPGGA